MKIFTTFILLFMLVQINGQSIETDKLKVAHTSLQKNNDLNNQNAFFELFPNSFESFTNLFGYKGGNESTIYMDGFQYVEAFFKLDSIQVERQINKLINISINGHWEADTVSFFQDNLRERVFENIDLTYHHLKKRTDKEIISFFYFFLYEIHPQNESIPAEFKKFEHRDKRFYKLIQTGLKRAIKDSGH